MTSILISGSGYIGLFAAAYVIARLISPKHHGSLFALSCVIILSMNVKELALAAELLAGFLSELIDATRGVERK